MKIKRVVSLIGIFILLVSFGCEKQKDPSSPQQSNKKIYMPYAPWRDPAAKAERDNPGLHSFEPWRHPAQKSLPPESPS